MKNLELKMKKPEGKGPGAKLVVHLFLPAPKT